VHTHMCTCLVSQSMRREEEEEEEEDFFESKYPEGDKGDTL
jgi:hypothetical protein